MYKLIIKILDKSRDEKVDIDVAYDKVAREDGIGYTEKLKKAYDLIVKHYDTITKLRREKDEDTVKAFCEALENGDMTEVARIKEEVKAR